MAHYKHFITKSCSRVEVVEKTLQPEGAQEGYTVSINLEDEHVTVNVKATTYFGARSVVYKSKNVY